MDQEANTALLSRAHTPPPSLPSWNSIRINTRISPNSSSSRSPSISPIATSPIFSNASPYSPHSKMLWQLSQSEPSLVPDAFPSDAVPLDLTQAIPKPSSSSGKERRRNTLHMDISISKLGHTRAVSDEDPILALGDSSLDTERADDDRRDEVVIVDEDGERRLRGRSHLRILGDERSSPIPHSPDADSEGRRKGPLHAPLHLACIAQSDSACPHGSNCPFSHVHKRPPSAHISLLSTPAFSPLPSKLHSRVSSLLPPVSLDAAVISRPPKESSSMQPRPDSEDWVPVGQKHSSAFSNQPSTPDWFAEPHSRSKVLQQTSPRRARTPKYDSLGLPLHPLVPQLDISQYRRFRRTHRSAGSNRSIDSALSGAESEERSDSGRSRGRRSRRGSMALGGKYAVSEVPPYRGSRSGTPSIEANPDSKSSIQESSHEEILYESPPPTIPVSSGMQPRVEKPSIQSSGDVPLSNVDIERAILREPFRKPQESPFAIPESTGAPSGTRKSGGRSIFMMGIQAISNNSSSSIGAMPKSSFPAFTFPAPDKDRAPLNIANDTPPVPATGGFGTQSPFIDSNRPRHGTSNTSGDSATREPTSPTFSIQSGSSRSTKSADPISLFSGPSFTDPTRPLFSGYSRLVATSADGPTPTPVGMRHRGAEWVKRQQGKDLRQAQRLEKALEEKRQTLKKKLDWRPPVVEEPGYGYGDGREVPVEVTLDTGEVMKVLSEEERQTIEKELERTEASLERVRQEILEHSGGVSSQVTSPSSSESIRLPAMSTLQSPPSMNLLPLSNSGLGPLREDKADIDMASKSPQMMSARERVMARNQLLRSNADLFGDAPVAGVSSSTQGRPEVVVRKSANILDLGLFNTPARMELEAGRNVGSTSVKPSMDDWKMRQDTKTESKAGIDAPSALPQAPPFEKPSAGLEQSETGGDADPEFEKAVQRNWSISPVPHSREDSAAIRSRLEDPKSQEKSITEMSTREQPRPRPQSQVPDSVQQKRRISMSTAAPGEEASSQTMQGLSFDDSDEDEDGEADDSREYLSAEEGYETANDETPDMIDEEIMEPPPTMIEVQPPRPGLQRKRSSTTTGLVLPSSETKVKPSPLDDWSFNFVSRSTRDVVSPGPYPSTMSTSGTSTVGAHSTPSSRSHLRKLSQDSAYSSSTPLTAYGAAPPNNTPVSPPPQRPIQMSPTPARAFESQQMAAFPSLQPYPESAKLPDPASPSDPQPVFDEPYFVVKRSANVLDEAANVIHYATARVMSGGVKIGSIQPRGDNGVIPEEDENEEDMEAVFETTDSPGDLEMVTGPAIPTPAAAFSPPHSQYATLPPVSPVPPYPMGVPVPGQLSAISVPAPAPVMVPSQQIPQPVVPIMTMPNAIPIPQVPALLNQPPSVVVAAPLQPIVSQHRTSIVSHATGQSSMTVTTTTPQSQPIEYCGDYRTTGHCRFGSRCRYSHDVEPRVKTSRNASSAIYRPSVASTNVPPSPVDPLPPVPPGYNLSNVFPQPHHIPGVPLSQQPHSPFVFAPSSSVAHPLTAPSATAAADRGVIMSDKDKATKILKSLGMNPQQVTSHRPAPVVMADGEVRYDMTRKRSVNPDRPDYSPSRPKPPSRVNSVDVSRTQDPPHTRVGTPRDSQPVMGSSAGMVMESEEEDIWTVSSGRQKRPSLSARDGDRSARRPSERDYLYQSEAQSRAFSPMNPPPSYSPAQPIHHPQHYSHVPPTQQHPTSHYHQPPPISHNAPAPVHPSQPAANPPQATLTQEEVFKVLAALGINVSSGPPSTSMQSVPPAYGTQQAPSSYIQQAPGHGSYHPGPYNYTPQHPPY